MTGHSLFGGLGREGIPADLRRILSREDGPEQLANIIIAKVEESLGDALGPDKPGSGPAPAWVRGLAQVLMEWFAGQGLPAPSIALKANAYALSLVSPDTRELLVPREIRQWLGLPTGVDLSDFALVAGREALALVYAIAPAGVELGELSRRVEAGEWVMSERSLSKEMGASEAARATVRAYRARVEYRAMVRNFAAWTLMARGLRGRLVHAPALGDGAIRERVRRIPSRFIIRALGNGASEYIPPA